MTFNLPAVFSFKSAIQRWESAMCPRWQTFFYKSLTKAAYGFLIKPLLYLCFVDNIHFVWTATRQLSDYEKFLNTWALK